MMISPDIELANQRWAAVDASRNFADDIVTTEFSDVDDGSAEILAGITSYLFRRGYGEDDLRDEEALVLVDEHRELVQEAIGASAIYAPEKFGFAHKPTSLSELFEAMNQTMQNTVHLTGAGELFQKRPDRHRERLSRYVADIDETTYLSLKGSTGVGASALDLAIGLQIEKDWSRNKGEMWRIGFDIQGEGDDKTLRILRSGSVMAGKKIGRAEKQEAALRFRKEHGISVSRALAATVLLTAHFDPTIREIIAPGFDTVADPLNGIRKSRTGIKFDYEGFWMGFGFSAPDESGWMHLPSDPHFYRGLLDVERSGDGIHGGELDGIQLMLETLDRMQGTRHSASHNLHTSADALDEYDLESSIVAHRLTLGRAA